MAKQFLVSIDLGKNELLNAVVQGLTQAPTASKPGQIYYNTVDKRLKWYDGTTWINADARDAQMSGEDIVTSINATDGAFKINQNQIAGFDEALQGVSMDGKAIITEINANSDMLIDLTKVNGLQDALDLKADKTQLTTTKADAVADAKTYVDLEIEKLIGIADLDGDTLGELQALIRENASGLERLASVPHKFGPEKIGDAIAKEFTITHNLNNQDAIVSVRRAASPFDEVVVDIEHTDANSVLVRFAEAPAEDEFSVSCVG